MRVLFVVRDAEHSHRDYVANLTSALPTPSANLRNAVTFCHNQLNYMAMLCYACFQPSPKRVSLNMFAIITLYRLLRCYTYWA